MMYDIDTILFDLDGTLLPMDEERFVSLYLKSISEAFADRYDPALLKQTLWEGTGRMAANRSQETNENLMWDLMESRFPGIRKDLPLFEVYYRTDFDQASPACPRREGTGEFIRRLAENYRLVLATNPLFPREAVLRRLKWAGVDPDCFAWITTYENSSRCKPDPAYYEQIIKTLHLDPARCLMVGNDAREDMNAALTGMRTFLVTDCLIDREGAGVDCFDHGTFEEFMARF